MSFVHALVEFTQKYKNKKYQHPNLQTTKTITSALTDTFIGLRYSTMDERIRICMQAVRNQQRTELFHTEPLDKKIDQIKSDQKCVQSMLVLYLIPDLSNIINDYMGFQEQLLFLQELKQDMERLPEFDLT